MTSTDIKIDKYRSYFPFRMVYAIKRILDIETPLRTPDKKIDRKKVHTATVLRDILFVCA